MSSFHGAILRKLRVLWLTEFTDLSTGFAVYGAEVLKRLHATGKYSLAELASYVGGDDPRIQGVPWPVFPVMPSKTETRELEIYNNNALNQFGGWRFEETCLKFRPDVVVAYRDIWNDTFAFSSPFRPFYHLATMPAIDSEPIRSDWLADYVTADAVFCYTDWGLEEIRRQSNGMAKTLCSTPPGADTETFRPLANKEKLRKDLGLPTDAHIVGTIMRNQARKLFPDLLEAFAHFLTVAPEELANKTFLYFHTCVPDIGWDIPYHLKSNGLGHKVYFTYQCRNCGAIFASLYQDARGVCPECHNPTAFLPGSTRGVSREALAVINNCFSVYVQHSCSEGLGMPQVEAAACGVPVMATDFSGMNDVVRKLNGIPIKVERYYWDAAKQAKHALPSNGDFVRKLINFLLLPKDVKAHKSFMAQQGVLEHYTYERTAKIWEAHLDSLEIRPEEKNWESPQRIHEPQPRCPEGLSDEQFVNWGLINLAGRPDLIGSHTALRMSRDLNWACKMVGASNFSFNEASMLGMQPRWVDYGREQVVQELLQLCEVKNHWERRRTEGK